MNDTLGLFAVKLTYKNKLIFYANSLLQENSKPLSIMLSKTISYRRVTQRNKIYRHGLIYEPLFLEKTKVVLLGISDSIEEPAFS